MNFAQILGNLPNLITLARMLMTPLAILMIVSQRFLPAFLIFILAGVSDAIDGFIAKNFDLRTELGAYLDPLADKALLISIYVSLAIYAGVPAWLAIIVVSRDVMIVVAVLVSWLLGQAGRDSARLGIEIQHRRPDRARGIRARRARLRPRSSAGADLSGMDGRRDDAGFGRHLHCPMARSYEPIGVAMTRSLASVSVLVPTYDEGLAFFRDSLGFVVLEDTRLDADRRWIVLGPPGGAGAAIVLAVPGDERQRARIGDQTGGRVGYFLHTDDFLSDYEAMRACGVAFLETPRREPYGLVAVFADPWGGKWDLLQPAGVDGEIA